MTKEELREKANDLPLAPGVYLMMDKTGSSLREKSSVVVLSLSMIFLTTLYTQIAQTSAKNTNFSLTYPTGKERFYC